MSYIIEVLMYRYYDIVIIGAGPSGLSLAHCCSTINKKIMVIDKESKIGGCHRVKRIAGGLFTEHGPRVYFSSYTNFFYLLSELGLDKNELFSNYKYDMMPVLKKFSFFELMAFAKAYLMFLMNNEYGEDLSLVKFCHNNNFSETSVDTLDRLCRFIDGADIKKYSVGMLARMMDTYIQGIQPKGPLDVLVFNKWQSYLEKKGVDFALGYEITYIHYCPIRKKIDYIVLNNTTTIYCNKLVLAIPPASMVKLLASIDNVSVQNAFGNLVSLSQWNEQTEYIEYISITYHFKGHVNIPAVQGLTFTEWGIIALNLSDYMQDIEAGYDRVLSVAVTICDKPSNYINKTANECNEKEIYEEVYRQLKTSIYPHLPVKYVAIMNPNNYYNKHEKKWENTDEAYFHTIGTNYLEFQSKTIPNMYNLGTHNGYSLVPLTTLESAVSNSMSLACKLFPQLRNRYYLRKAWRVSEMIYFGFLVICITIIIIYMCYTHI